MAKTADHDRITDSPWLWAALFTGFGLAALLATGGKFGKRQAGIENKYQARAAVASGQLQVEQTGSGKQVARGVPKYTTPEKVAVPVWPLEILLGAIFTGSLFMLLRQLFGAPRPAAVP
jgi:hypothetical protein